MLSHIPYSASGELHIHHWYHWAGGFHCYACTAFRATPEETLEYQEQHAQANRCLRARGIDAQELAAWDERVSKMIDQYKAREALANHWRSS